MKQHRSRFASKHSLAITGFAALAASVGAQTATNTQPYRLDRVVVTADPSGATSGTGSASLITGEELQLRQVLSARDLSGITPNLATFDANGDRTPRFSIRGLRENNFSYGESALVLYVDDVPYSDLYTRGTPLFDLESAEVLRGPQGTLFGASRPGGVVNLLTRLPSNTTQGHGTVRFATDATVSLDGGVSGPIIKDQLFVGVSGLFFDREGYFNNTILGTKPDDRNNVAGRAQLRWTPTESVDVTFSTTVERVRDGAVITRPITAPGDLHDVRMDSDGLNNQDSHTFSLRAAWTGEKVRVISVTTRRDWRQQVQGDFDFQEYTFGVAAPSLQAYGSPDVQQWSQELRVESADKDAPLKWNAGAYWAQLTTDHDVGSVYGPAAVGLTGFGDSTQARLRGDTYALFGQATYTLWEKLDLTAGLRLELEDRSIGRTRLNQLAFFPAFPPAFGIDQTFGITYSASDSYSSIQPKAGLTYRFTKDWLAWFTFSTGFQPGGFSPSENTAASAAYNAAESLHYELGTRASFLDGKLTASASGFFIQTDDYQVYRNVGGNPFAFRVLNAREVETWGAEADLVARPCEWFEAALAGGWTRSEFKQFNDTTGASFAGKDVSFIPEFTLDASVTAKHSCGAFATVGVTGVGKYFADEANTVSQGSYALLRAAIGWKNETVSISVFGRNLLDKQYYANMTDFGNGFIAGTPGDPFVTGVELTARF
jgi:iron complex outermembrane receptor protein